MLCLHFLPPSGLLDKIRHKWYEAFRALGSTSSGQGQSTPRILSHRGCNFGRGGQTDTYVEAILTWILEVTVLRVGTFSHCRHHWCTHPWGRRLCGRRSIFGAVIWIRGGGSWSHRNRAVTGASFRLIYIFRFSFPGLNSFFFHSKWSRHPMEFHIKPASIAHGLTLSVSTP